MSFDANPPTRPLYNFRLGPEAIFLVVNTVIGTVLVQLVTTDFGSITDWHAWLLGLGISALRTAIGLILTLASGGQVLSPGQAPERSTTG